MGMLLTLPTILETLGMQPEELRDRPVDIKEEDGFDGKNDGVAGEVTPTKNFTLKEFPEILKVQRIKFGSCSRPRKE